MKCIKFNYAQSQGLVQMLALLNVVMIQMVLGNVMFTSKATAVHVLSLVMKKMIAVQMYKSFACVSAIAKF